MKWKPLLTLEEFLSLSAKINYLLAAKEINYSAILERVLNGAELDSYEREIAEEGIKFLCFAYRNRARRLGPVAVLHPLRTAHILVLSTEHPTALDLLTAFLHDYFEDIYTKDTSADFRKELEKRYQTLTGMLPPEQSDQLNYRLDMLTKRRDEEYHSYLGRLMKQARYSTEIIWVKLADRLDNTFDMRIVEEENADQCFQRLFDILFLHPQLHRYRLNVPPSSAPIDEAHRLFQMFKNAVFLSLVRRSELDSVNLPAQTLFQSLALASIHEAGRILMQIFSHHIVNVEDQRRLLLEVLEYSQQGGLHRITPSERGSRLDGLFKERFDHADRSQRERALKELQEDKELMAISALAFLGVFESFIVSPTYRLGGVKETGLSFDDTLG